MKVEIKLFFNFSEFLPSDSENKTALITLEDGTTVQGLINHLGLPEQVPKTVLVNGRNANEQTELKDSDSVAIFPPMAGG